MKPIPDRDRILKYKKYQNDEVAAIKIYSKLVREGKPDQAESFIHRAAYWNPVLFMQFYMSDTASVPFAPHHYQILKAIPNGTRNRRINILAPRGSSKTTLMTRVYVLHRILYYQFDQEMGFPEERFILIITHAEENSHARIQSLIDDIETNPHIQRDFGDIRGKRRWGVSNIITSTGFQITPLTRGKKIRGSLAGNFRPTLIILDDIDDVKALQNPDNRSDDQDWFFAAVLQAGQIGKSNFVLIDTLKHEESLANLARQRPSWRTLFFQAIQQPDKIMPHPTAEELWKQFEIIYSNRLISDDDREEQADQFYEEHKELLTAGVQELWPEQITYYDMRKAIVDDGYDFVLREYQNDITYTSFRVFDMGLASKFKIIDEGLLVTDWRLAKLKTDEEIDPVRLVEWDDIVGVSIYHDWAGGHDTFKNDFSAIAVIAWSRKPPGVHSADDVRDSMGGQYGYVLQVHVERHPQHKQIEKLFDLAEEALNTIKVNGIKILVGFERMIDGTGTAVQAYEDAFYYERSKRTNPEIARLTTRQIDQSQNKMRRIYTLQGPIAYGHLSFHEDIFNISPEFISQMSQFPTADHDDGPDSLQGGVRYEIRPTTTAEEDDRRAFYNRQYASNREPLRL